MYSFILVSAALLGTALTRSTHREAGFALADFAVAHTEIFEGKQVLDLGAGASVRAT